MTRSPGAELRIERPTYDDDAGDSPPGEKGSAGLY